MIHELTKVGEGRRGGKTVLCYGTGLRSECGGGRNVGDGTSLTIVRIEVERAIEQRAVGKCICTLLRSRISRE